MADHKQSSHNQGDIEEQQRSSLLDRLLALALYVPHFIRDEIWRERALGERSWKGRAFGFLRVGTLIFDGIRANRLPVQAASLGYYTLVALGPLVAIAIMISSFIIKDNSKETIVDALTRLTYFIAPQAEQAVFQPGFGFDDEILSPKGSLLASPLSGHSPTEANPTADDSLMPPSPLLGTVQTSVLEHTPAILSQLPATQIPAPQLSVHPLPEPEEEELNTAPKPSGHLVNAINHLVSSARSGTMGVVGSLTLIVISIGLIANIEKTFNAIWGVHGRPLVQQVIIYWTLITMGAVIGATALTLGLAKTAARTFDHLPLGGSFLRELFLKASPFLAFLLVLVLLASFYRFIPNIRVRWKPAFIGATCVALLLYANQFASFLYIGFVVRQGSLFGAVGILPVLLFGLFIFWLFILLGGQITYAVQNVNTLTNQRLWENVSHRSQELLALAALVLVCRRYDSCKRPYSAGELSRRIRVPANILNSTLGMLCNIGYLVTVTTPCENNEEIVDRYQPGRPLNKITLAEFKQTFEKWGNNDAAGILNELDPLLAVYQEHLLKVQADSLGTRDLQSMFAGEQFEIGSKSA